METIRTPSPTRSQRISTDTDTDTDVPTITPTITVSSIARGAQGDDIESAARLGADYTKDRGKEFILGIKDNFIGFFFSSEEEKKEIATREQTIAARMEPLKQIYQAIGMAFTKPTYFRHSIVVKIQMNGENKDLVLQPRDNDSTDFIVGSEIKNVHLTFQDLQRKFCPSEVQDVNQLTESTISSVVRRSRISASTSISASPPTLTINTNINNSNIPALAAPSSSKSQDDAVPPTGDNTQPSLQTADNQVGQNDSESVADQEDNSQHISRLQEGPDVN